MTTQTGTGLTILLAALALAHGAHALVIGRPVWFPSLRLLVRHSDQAVSAYIAEVAEREVNHPYVRATEAWPPLSSTGASPTVPKGFRVNARRQLLGSGVDLYARVVEQGLRGKRVVDDLQWAKLITAESADWRKWNEGMVLMTIVKCFGLLWSANPCRLVYARWDAPLSTEVQGGGKYSSLGFSTLVGHLIEGEERFTVEWWEEDDSVWLDLLSVSRGSGILGMLSMPLIRPIQKAFFAAQCRCM
ncbi:unnamed protein product, partial [Discosporangium mesarthrocarpum]